MKKIILIFSAILILWSGIQSFAAEQQTNPTVTVKTTLGSITLELNKAKAPKTVANFLAYVDSGYYNKTIFHRVIKRFMIQGGGLTQDMRKKTTKAPITNEADNGLANKRGTIAMARTGAPHSATSQFFINTKNNSNLNFTGKGRGWGYCVFGKVIKGMDVVDAIENSKTTSRNGRRDVPVTPIVIESITRN